MFSVGHSIFVPEVSVIIPVYNTEQFLGDCLDSVLAQTFTDFEAIVIDDGSTDNSRDIIEAFAKKDSRIVCIHQENRGLSEARNAGLDIAKGNWITFIDSDDAIAPTFLEKSLFTANNSAAEISCCASRAFKEDEAVANKGCGDASPSGKDIHEMTPAEALANALYQNKVPDYSAWNKLYAADLWRERRFPPGKFFEDVATIPQVFLDAKKIAFLAEPLYLYRKHSSSILATAYSRKKAELLDIAESVCKLVQGKGVELEQAATCNLFSASCSILMRTPDTQEFADFRDRAWDNILRTRKATRSPKARFRNKVAALCSLGGRAFFEMELRRFG